MAQVQNNVQYEFQLYIPVRRFQYCGIDGLLKNEQTGGKINISGRKVFLEQKKYGGGGEGRNEAKRSNEFNPTELLSVGSAEKRILVRTLKKG